MADFWTAFTKHETAALATAEGREFADSNFSYTHTGGGCTAWTRDINDTGHRVIITDSSGSEAFLNLENEPADCWLIGAHGYDGGWVQPREAHTVADAIAAADEMHRLVVAKDWQALDGDEADLPLGEKPDAA